MGKGPGQGPHTSSTQLLSLQKGYLAPDSWWNPPIAISLTFMQVAVIIKTRLESIRINDEVSERRVQG
jgi:hypothetical protein